MFQFAFIILSVQFLELLDHCEFIIVTTLDYYFHITYNNMMMMRWQVLSAEPKAEADS